jgi:DNA-binding transcriptional ArsR family regulator
LAIANRRCEAHFVLLAVGADERDTIFNRVVEQLDRTFAALADPTRRAILERLADGEATVNELAEPFPVTIQAVSKHLQVLERAGRLERGRTAQLRPSRLRGTPLKEATEWLESYRGFWEESFDRLDQRLRTDRK